jgi:hypothetical protein
MRKRNLRNKERGMALLIALMALLLISAVGLGMMYMSTGETSINGNYKDTQTAFFAMRAGLEEARDRMRVNSTNKITLPTAMPGQPNSIVYITNSDGNPVVPTSSANKYFDDEFCHEQFAGSGVAYVAPGAGTCTAAPTTGVSTVLSTSPYNNSSSAQKYKWVRITLKQNNTFPNAVVDPPSTDASEVCWDSAKNREVSATALGYGDCPTAKTAGYQVQPVYIVTTMALTFNGSRRIGQYETAAENMNPPPGALSLDGPAPPTGIFNPVPNGSQYYVNGDDGSHPPPPHQVLPPATPNSCSTTSTDAPAIGTSSSGVASIQSSTTGIPSNRDTNYISGNSTALSTPSSIVDNTAQLSTTMFADPASLNNLVSMLADGADATVNSTSGVACSVNNLPVPPATSAAPCGPPAQGLGTPANPQITYVNGDLNLSGLTTGAGVLIVTGNLNIVGNPTFDGLVLVIGQGIMTVSGGGSGTFFGSVFVANTNSHTSPFTPLTTVGSPDLRWSGGGGNGIYYNSCWADIMNTMHYLVIASREEMY